MASILRKLNDADLETIHNMIRRDAETDLEIATHAEKLLGEEIAKTDRARVAIVGRYRNGKAYAEWMDRRIETDRRLIEIRERYQHVANMVSGGDVAGFDQVSKTVQARQLTLAIEATDEQLVDGSESNGWIATTIRLAREVQRDQWREQVGELKATIERLLHKRKGQKVDTKLIVAEVDKILGLTK